MNQDSIFPSMNLTPASGVSHTRDRMSNVRKNHKIPSVCNGLGLGLWLWLLVCHRCLKDLLLWFGWVL